MKNLLAVVALVTVAASSHAVLIDDFTTGAFNSGYQSDPTSSYSAVVSATVLGGERFVSYTKTANPNFDDFRVRVINAPAMLAFTNGIEVDGIGTLAYGDSTDLNADFTGNGLVTLNVIANDLPNPTTVTIVSSTFGTVTRNFVIPASTATQVATFDFTGEAALGDVDELRFDFDFAPSGDFAVNRVEAVPEPFSMAALATGVALLGLRRRKR